MTAAPESPYKLLDYFTDSPEDRRRFGGRDREIHDLVTRITNGRTLVVYGPSGIGKTSLLQAGVFPALRERGYQPVYVRLLTSPLDDLHDALARAGQAGPVAVVIDQLEELFLRFAAQPKERAAFLSALAEAVKDRTLDVTVVLSLREDYLANLDELRARLPDLLADRYRVGPLTAFGVRQAISRPLVDAGVDYEPAVVSRLIGQLGEVGYEPSLLQILCSELYKAAVRRTGGGVPRITLADLESLGGQDGVFRRYLESVAAELPPQNHLLARMVLDALITAEGTRRAARLSDLLISGFSAPESDVQGILDWLVSHRLLRREERNGEDWYELVHEKLVPLLREWLDLDPQFVRFRQARAYVRNTSTGELWRESPDTLLSAETLTNLLHPFQERFLFSPRELELVVRSAIFRQSEELPFWAGRQGADLARGLLLGFLSADRRDPERLAAAVSARRLDDPTGELARACLRAALADAGEDVRWQAGVSLATLARPEDVQALLREPDAEKRRAVLQALDAGGHDLAGASRREKWSAKYHNRSRTIDQQRQLIRQRVRLGAKSGALAGLVWTLALLAVFAISSPGLPAPFALPMLGVFSLHWLLIVVELVGIGALVGYVTANAAARQAVIEKQEGRWVKALYSDLVILAVWLFLGFSAGWFIAGREAGLWILILWIPVSLIPVAVAEFSRPFVGFGSSPAGTWLGSLLISLGVPTLVALIFVFGGRKLLGDNLLAGRAGVAVASMAFFSFVISVALVRSTAAFPVGGVAEAPKRKQFPTAVTLLAFLIVLALVRAKYPNTFLQGIRNLAQHPPIELKDPFPRSP